MSNTETPSLEEMYHSGVLGMKWGHRKAASGKDIRSARARLNVKQAKYGAQVDELRRTTKRGSAERAKGQAKLKATEKDFNKDKDRAIAVRMTRGEKVASLIIAGPFGLIPIATSSAISRRIEKKQDEKKY